MTLPLPVAGFCPACGQQDLVLLEGRVICAWPSCGRKTAAAEILADGETQHIVRLTAISFTVRHPLRERLDDALMKCKLHDWIAQQSAAPHGPGTYRVVLGLDLNPGTATWTKRA